MKPSLNFLIVLNILLLFSLNIQAQAECLTRNYTPSSSPLNQPLYNAYETLISDDIVASTTAPVVFEAGDCIELEAGFEVMNGTDFTAEIAPCTPDHPIVHGHVLEHRLLRIGSNLNIQSSYEAVLTNMTRAANACYTGIVLSDAFFGFIEDLQGNANYINNLHTVLDSAKVLGMDVIPEQGYIGYSDRILYHDPNMAEGFPVVDAPFVVQNGASGLELVNDPADQFPIINGDFENLPASGHVVPGWGFQDSPGTVTFIDQTVSHSGNASVRAENTFNDPTSNGRFVQTINNFDQYRDYHVSLWIKTENFNPASADFLVLNNEGRPLEANFTSVSPTQDWTQYHFTFNTLNSTQIYIYLGVWGSHSGKIWWDDLEIQPMKFINILRRNTTPVSITKDDGTPLAEGVDIDMIIDPILGNDPWQGAYSNWHTEPTVGIPAGSSLQVGDRVLVDYFHATTVYNSQVCASMTEPAVFDIMEDQHNNVRAEFMLDDMFSGWYWQFDEIRQQGWDESPDYGSSGDNLAYCINETYNRARAADEDALIITTNSMFDPYHNADVEPFYLAFDSYNGSWNGLQDDVVIANWNSFTNRVPSVEHFANLGNRQMLLGFYDSTNFYTNNWLNEVAHVDGIIGVAYATWINDFSQIENWANHVWGGCNFTVATEDSPQFKNSITLLPNPTTQNFKIKLEQEEHIKKIEIFSKNGQAVWQSNNHHKNEIMLPQHISKGMYIVVVTTQHNIYREKLMLQ